MPDLSAPGTPSALRPAPPRASTPLPATFALHQHDAVTTFDGGAVLFGGDPPHLFRISDRAQTLVERWRSGAVLGPNRAARLLARRLVSAGALSPSPTAAAFTLDDVTVVVPVRDRAEQLDRLLGSLAGLDCIVVDDASRQAGATEKVAERHGARFVGLATNVGPGGARNAGLAAVQGALVAFVDSDCVARPGWLEPLLGHFDDPLVAAAAPRIVPAADRSPSALRRYEAVRSPLDRGPTPGSVRPGAPVPFVPSAALVVRTDVVTGPELFDPSLRSGEDVDLVWRLGEAGWDTRYVPASTVAHEGPGTLAGFLSRQTFYGLSAAPLARRHPGALAPVLLSPWSLAVWLLALARHPLLALTALAAPIVILARRLEGLVRDPVAVAVRIVGGGTARGALPSLAGLVRAWSPALLVGLLFRRTRRWSAVALTLPALRAWGPNRAAVDPIRYMAMHVADDAAYGMGVWVGCGRETTLGPLVPRIAWRSRVWSSPTLQRDLSPRTEAPPPDA